jgi:hypothetical protein
MVSLSAANPVQDRNLFILFIPDVAESEGHRAWQSDVLIPALLALPGALNAQAFEIAPTKPLPGTNAKDFGEAVIVEVEGSTQAARDVLQAQIESGEFDVSPASAQITNLIYQPVSPLFESERLTGFDDSGRRHAMLIWSKRPQPPQEYDTWYDEVHIQDFLAAPGVLRAQRFIPAEVPTLHGASVPDLGHLAYYEVDGDLGEVREEIKAQLIDGRMTLPSFIRPPFDALFLCPVGPLRKSGE